MNINVLCNTSQAMLDSPKGIFYSAVAKILLNKSFTKLSGGQLRVTRTTFASI